MNATLLELAKSQGQRSKRDPEAHTLPHKFILRKYQQKIWMALLRGFKRIYVIWHRRAGKDRVCWNLMVFVAWLRKGTYFYFLPTYKQAKEVIWKGIDERTGLTFLDHIPGSILADKNEAEMRITLKNGSTVTLLAADQYDRIVGTNPVGVVFSEFALQHPSAWDYIRPILAENGGWVIFITTPRGHNHAHDLWDIVEDLDEWYTEVLTVDDTGAVTEDTIDADRVSGMDPDRIQQEYYCSFEGAIHGAYYSKLISDARREGRITHVPYNPVLQVHTWWDIGRDTTSIWFTQTPKDGNTHNIINYYENKNTGMKHYLSKLREFEEDLGYIYAEKHNGPHDMANNEWGADMTRIAIAASLGFNFIASERLQQKEDGYEAVRSTLPICYFDEEKCRIGIKGLENHRKKWDEEKRVFGREAIHDWASHPSDAFMEFAVNVRKTVIRKEAKRRTGGRRAPDYNPLSGEAVRPKQTRKVAHRRSTY